MPAYYLGAVSLNGYCVSDSAVWVAGEDAVPGPCPVTDPMLWCGQAKAVRVEDRSITRSSSPRLKSILKNKSEKNLAGKLDSQKTNYTM